ncbi:MAG: transcriptional regulator NrdR [Solirubrobacterales bacterium]
MASRIGCVRCPSCASPQTRVRESRAADGGAAVRRRRECPECGRRFTTYERLEPGPLQVRKRDRRRQAFDRAKLRGGIARAAHKRPVSAGEVDALVASIEAEAERAGGEIATARVGELCLEGLRRIDRVAYLQFAAVYKQLDVEQVGAELAALGSGEAQPDGKSPLVAEISGEGSIRPESDPG